MVLMGKQKGREKKKDLIKTTLIKDSKLVAKEKGRIGRNRTKSMPAFHAEAKKGEQVGSEGGFASRSKEGGRKSC